MKILIIRPNMHKTRSKDAMQPLFAAVLAALTPKDIELKLYDDKIEEIPYDEPADLVAISIETFSAKRGYEIAGKYRERGIKVIVGGFHPTSLPDEAICYADSVAIGNAENIWHLVINDLKNNNLKKFYKAGEDSGDIIAKFDRSIFGNKPYGPVELVQWGMGCRYNCDFCSIKSFYKSKQYFRPIQDVVNEIRSLRKKTVFFVDDNLYDDKDKLKHFIKEITPLKIKWTCQISIDIAKDDSLLHLMRRSGCFMVLVGIESFNHDNLKLMNKKWINSGMEVEKSIQKIMKFGIMIYGTFIFGYDFDSEESFRSAVDFAIRNDFMMANFNTLYPMPGTPLFERMKNEKRLTYDNWWLHPDFYYGKSMFHPKSMSAFELEKYGFEAKKEFNSLKSIFKRSLNPAIIKSIRNLLLFFYGNMVNRKEVYRKQGRSLGK